MLTLFAPSTIDLVYRRIQEHFPPLQTPIRFCYGEEWGLWIYYLPRVKAHAASPPVFFQLCGTWSPCRHWNTTISLPQNSITHNSTIVFGPKRVTPSRNFYWMKSFLCVRWTIEALWLLDFVVNQKESCPGHSSGRYQACLKRVKTSASFWHIEFSPIYKE